MFAEVSSSLKMDKMESVRVLNLNTETLPQFPSGLLPFFLFLFYYLQSLQIFVFFLVLAKQT